MVPSPASGFYHHIGRFLVEPLTCKTLPEDSMFFRQLWITKEKLYEKCFLLTGNHISPCKRMPPPVVALVPQFSLQHTPVFSQIVLIEHLVSLMVTFDYRKHFVYIQRFCNMCIHAGLLCFLHVVGKSIGCHGNDWNLFCIRTVHIPDFP